LYFTELAIFKIFDSSFKVETSSFLLLFHFGIHEVHMLSFGFSLIEGRISGTFYKIDVEVGAFDSSVLITSFFIEVGELVHFSSGIGVRVEVYFVVSTGFGAGVGAICFAGSCVGAGVFTQVSVGLGAGVGVICFAGSFVGAGVFTQVSAGLGVDFLAGSGEVDLAGLLTVVKKGFYGILCTNSI